MKLNKLTALMVGLISSSALFASDISIDLPSSVPIKTFEVKENQIGIGYIMFDVKLEIEDDYYGDKIGDVDYKTNGFIYTYASSKESFFGEEFETSFTAGTIESELKDNIFVDSGYRYNNTYDKSGFYIGYRPAYSYALYSEEKMNINIATSLHYIFFTLGGDYSISRSDGQAYAYDETTYGLGLKPTSVLQGTYKPLSNIAVSFYGGLSTFIALSVTDYENKVDSSDYDTEGEFLAENITPLYGWDIAYKFSNDSILNLSTAFANYSSNQSTEVVVRYIFTF